MLVLTGVRSSVIPGERDGKFISIFNQPDSSCPTLSDIEGYKERIEKIRDALQALEDKKGRDRNRAYIL